MVTPYAKRKAVVRLMEMHQVSQRRECYPLDVDRSTVRYRSCRAEDADFVMRSSGFRKSAAGSGITAFMSWSSVKASR